jgi:hypothetical protein
MPKEGWTAVFRKLITRTSRARGAVARPRVCPACGITARAMSPILLGWR